ncbi:hypothetical protein HB364_12440 [Pseudoflavitalea sp. X16]|uniref:hypothetical protein n=1 Tax=Paraflavitalea devenefica TaxID=2716334 RepID=UPI001422364D|nr:hypothetical protein [Paraflavitalea devenefica]NII25898.1 hypothetical protein [Paraflavitalea devenefica]
MAKVISLFKIRGTIGGVTFRQTQDGMVAGEKPGPTREQVLTSDRFAGTRRHANEFKTAIRDATLLRRSLGNTLNGVHHSKLNGMMHKLLYAASQRDKHSPMGFRHAAAGDIGLLEGFEFNPDLSLDDALRVRFEHSMDITTGVLYVTVPGFVARKKKVFPADATHFRLVSCGAVINFTENRCTQDIEASRLMPLGKKTPGVIHLKHAVKAGEGDVIVQAMGIEFYKMVHGKKVLLKFGALRILRVGRIG